LRFIIDAQLPPALARAIQDETHKADHLIDIGLLQASDDIIWRYAALNRAAIITKDEDFVFKTSPKPW
jgi:predicted nuclease of predicted toxin-antitoxin system